MWISVEDRLPDSKVIASYKNRQGKPRTIMAEYYKKYSVESTMEDGVVDEYNEDNDTYYVVSGWYESIENWEDWSSISIEEIKITHWMPLPEPPERIKESDGE